METKKIYMVPETAYEQFLKPFGILMESDPTNPSGNGTGDVQENPILGAPGRKPF